MGDWTKRDEEEALELGGEKYFHGSLPRQIVDRILRSDGEFLLRYNDKDKNRGFVISVRWEGQIRHFKITRKKDGSGVWIKKEKSFKKISELVAFYIRSGASLAKEDSEVGLVRIMAAAPKDRWELKGKDVQLVSKIGQGAFGEVWRALLTRKAQKDRDSATDNTATNVAGALEVAAKICKEKDADARLKFRKEAMFQLRFSHKNIVKMIGVIVSEDPMMIVLEYLRNGSLNNYLVKHKRQLGVKKLTKFCLEAARGMKYLESLRVIHRDVASRNCLVSAKEEVKISDFGLAKSQERYKMQIGKVAIKWMSPESMKTGEYTVKSDVWAFGVLVWEVMSFGAEPYPGLNGADVKHKILVDKFRMEAPPGTPDLVARLMEDCWEAEPKARPSFAQLSARLDAVPAAQPATVSASNSRNSPRSSKQRDSDRTFDRTVFTH